MSDTTYSQLRESIEVGFFDAQYSHGFDEKYLPQFLVNDREQKKKVIDQLDRELKYSDYFWFSVAFMTTGGVAVLKQQLQVLEQRGIQGKILVSQYQNFTQPQALREILKLSNIELRMATVGNYHAKGYLFDRADNYTLIVGSSNLTEQALTQNQEWNLKVVTTKKAKLAHEALAEFQSAFENAEVVTQEFITQYEQVYEQTKQSWNSLAHVKRTETQLQPNKMQLQALRGINDLYNRGKTKALLVSATGTGKTYLSAFHVKEKSPNRFLFLVHRENIARAALESYRKVLGKNVSLGIYSGNEKSEADYLFATIQTMSQTHHMETFDKNHFDYIVIDETHRAGAKSYKKILEYFNPRFLLGMTATPERTDGFDVFSQFDHNLAYEIRLHQALEQEMLCPFHYYGVSDLIIDGEMIDEKSDFNRLVVDTRVDYIYEKMMFYSCDDGKVRGLIFCSRNEEATEIAYKLSLKGLRTLALSGKASEVERQRAIERLELSHDDEQKLDYLLTVDIFNEGIDIPAVNQVVMLRPTQSAIVFVQQLGRGLRKTQDKQYLTVIDFIGNYANNFLVPVALFGDQSYNKDHLRQLIVQGTTQMPSSCSVHFDEIAKKQIFKAIDTQKLNARRNLIEDYKQLEYKIGYQPMMMDFIRFGSRDPYQYVQNAKSYFNFVQSLDKKSESSLNEKAEQLLVGFQNDVLNGQRITEVVALDILIKQHTVTYEQLQTQLWDTYRLTFNESDWHSCLLNIQLRFTRDKYNGVLVPYAEKYDLSIIHISAKTASISPDFIELLNNSIFRTYLCDAVAYARHRFDKDYRYDIYRAGFLLGRKYSRKDVFRILNWEENPVAQNVGGYMISKDQTNCPIFVTYHKSEDISETTQYEDQFLNESLIEWYSKSGRTLGSNDVQLILSAQEKRMRLPLFVKKNDDEGIDFYYLGDMYPVPHSQQQLKLAGKNIVQLKFQLCDGMDDKLYEYMTTE